MTIAAPARYRLIALLALTLIFGGLNALKPLHIDDAAYFCDARQIAADPLNPYGTWILWWQQPQPANEILAPPVVPYTWALGLRLFGDHPAACKLLLLPWAFLLVYAFFSLARRFAAGMEWPLTILAIFSPALWPSFNFMLDIPALGLALMAIELFFRACDATSFFKAACAGLIAGVGFQTKYTACVAVAAILLAAVLRRRWALGIVAILLAAHVVCAWEFLTAILYGHSHFFLRFASGDAPTSHRLLDAIGNRILTRGPLCTSLLSLLGSITPALLLLGLAAFGLRRRWLVFTAILFLGGVLAIALFDSHLTGTITPSARFFGLRQTPSLQFELADVIFGVFGGVMLLVAAITAWSLFRSSSGDARRDVLFLIGWLGLEIAAFFPLTDFPAVRRVLGIVIVMTLLIGRGAAQTCRAEARRFMVYHVVMFGVMLGVALSMLDVRYAQVQQEGAAWAAKWIREHGGGRMVYAGHWGFQYYAEHNGMEPLIVDYESSLGLPEPTRLQPGDWLVLPDDGVSQQTFQCDPDCLREVARLTFDDPVPLRTIPAAFHGGTEAVQHLEGPRFQLRIYQVQQPIVPRPKPSPP
jgi:hypothetical protein